MERKEFNSVRAREDRRDCVGGHGHLRQKRKKVLGFERTHKERAVSSRPAYDMALNREPARVTDRGVKTRSAPGYRRGARPKAAASAGAAPPSGRLRHTVNISQHTVNIQSTSSQHTVNIIAKVQQTIWNLAIFACMSPDKNII